MHAHQSAACKVACAADCGRQTAGMGATADSAADLMLALTSGKESMSSSDSTGVVKSNCRVGSGWRPRRPRQQCPAGAFPAGSGQ